MVIAGRGKRSPLHVLTRKHGVREENPLMRVDDKYYPDSHIRTPELREEADKFVPAKSGKQYRFMQGIAHGMKPRHGAGPSQKVAKEFVEETPASKRKMFAKAKNKY